MPSDTRESSASYGPHAAPLLYRCLHASGRLANEMKPTDCSWKLATTGAKCKMDRASGLSFRIGEKILPLPRLITQLHWPLLKSRYGLPPSFVMKDHLG